MNHKRFCGLMIGLALLAGVLITPLSVDAQDPVQQAAAGSAIPPDSCVACHASELVMQTMAKDKAANSMAGSGEGPAGTLPPMKAWEKVLVHEEFVLSLHNTQTCADCHGGAAGMAAKDAAHEGMVRDPLEESDRTCVTCHSPVTGQSASSLHQTLGGFRTALAERGADIESPEMQAALSNHCSTCHTTCGQCHISRPTSQGGGLLNGHEVEGMASTSDTCVACHGARVANEYRGENEGVEGSVHWVEEAMPCDACHDVDQLHGDGTEYSHRYDAPAGVDCLACHEEAAPERSTVKEHQIHTDKVDCYVCHVSGPYKNCFDCHVALDDEGLAYFETAESQMDFKIGRNPLKSEDRPWEYSLVRHVPVAPDTFAYYGEDLLPSFDNLPTWKYATPHNIQLQTPQNQACEHCHNNPDVFLLAADVSPEEASANAGVVVDKVPVLPHPGLSEYDIPGACTGCHPKAADWNWELSSASVHSLDQVVKPSGTVIECEDCHSHPGLSEYDIPGACTGCHPNAAESNWDVISESIHSLDHVVKPSGTVIECEDCHSPDGNFDWAAAGFGSEETEELMWIGYSPIEAVAYADGPSTAPYWVLGGGVVVAVGIMMPLVRRRNGRKR